MTVLMTRENMTFLPTDGKSHYFIRMKDFPSPENLEYSERPTTNGNAEEGKTTRKRSDFFSDPPDPLTPREIYESGLFLIWVYSDGRLSEKKIELLMNSGWVLYDSPLMVNVSNRIFGNLDDSRTAFTVTYVQLYHITLKIAECKKVLEKLNLNFVDSNHRSVQEKLKSDLSGQILSMDGLIDVLLEDMRVLFLNRLIKASSLRSVISGNMIDRISNAKNTRHQRTIVNRSSLSKISDIERMINRKDFLKVIQENSNTIVPIIAQSFNQIIDFKSLRYHLDGEFEYDNHEVKLRSDGSITIGDMVYISGNFVIWSSRCINVSWTVGKAIKRALNTEHSCIGIHYVKQNSIKTVFSTPDFEFLRSKTLFLKDYQGTQRTNLTSFIKMLKSR